MDKTQFLNIIKELGSVESVSGITYRIDGVNDSFVIGTRSTTQKEFKIEIDGLFRAYQDMKAGMIMATTTALKGYVNRTQSPALAILIALSKLH